MQGVSKPLGAASFSVEMPERCKFIVHRHPVETDAQFGKRRDKCMPHIRALLKICKLMGDEVVSGDPK